MVERKNRGESSIRDSQLVDPAGHASSVASGRRRYSRRVLSSGARLRIGLENGESVVAKLIDISAGGARLRSVLVPRIGAKIAIELERLGTLPSRVLRRFSNGIAVEFDLTGDQREALAHRLVKMHLATGLAAG